jgi:hypothetical protein
MILKHISQDTGFVIVIASPPNLFSSLEIIPNFAPSRAAFAFPLPRSTTATAKKPKPPSNLISRKPKWISSYSPAS